MKQNNLARLHTIACTLLMALSLTLTACGDDDDENINPNAPYVEVHVDRVGSDSSSSVRTIRRTYNVQYEIHNIEASQVNLVRCYILKNGSLVTGQKLSTGHSTSGSANITDIVTSIGDELTFEVEVLTVDGESIKNSALVLVRN